MFILTEFYVPSIFVCGYIGHTTIVSDINFTKFLDAGVRETHKMFSLSEFNTKNRMQTMNVYEIKSFALI